ncbi:MAG: hypothetical protein CL605_04000 [Altibacter sp.]|uniref:hypothetical protein n=1 Tax=Altibacter sp. TaxID=2024823 RepID=UPI000C901A7D|nr:hypothetical protein [Altibacter sp.]MAP54044.1 hypothetical protein [Altibacter sp.]|tara:strand:- start:18 stop:323 length:306 start_codon:yes stop_codon:yes gene_type:complete
MNECKKCNGRLAYTIFDRHADANISVDCWDCLSELNYKDNVSANLSRLLRNASPEKLAQLLSSYFVEKMHLEREGDLSRLENMIESKELNNVLALCSAYIG